MSISTKFGVFDERCEGQACYGCKRIGGVLYRSRESSDGGHVDHEYFCEECGYTHWVDGIDS